MVTFMTVGKAIIIRRRNGGPSSRLIQTFLREGKFEANSAVPPTLTFDRGVLLYPHLNREPGALSTFPLSRAECLSCVCRSTESFISSTSLEILPSERVP